MADNNRPLSGRDERGKFAPGNPGRPFGAKAKASKAALEAVKEMRAGALEKLYEAVASGERWAIEFVLGKVLPATRTIEFEGSSVQDVAVAMQAGDISPDEAYRLSGVLKNLADIEQLENLRSRITELEAVVNERRR